MVVVMIVVIIIIIIIIVMLLLLGKTFQDFIIQPWGIVHKDLFSTLHVLCHENDGVEEVEVVEEQIKVCI